MNSIRRLFLGGALGLIASAPAVVALANQPDDAWITTKVKMALLTDGAVNGLVINVDTFDGKVTLHGRATSETEKAAAEQHARAIHGVRDVRNLVAVVPDSAHEAMTVDDLELAKQVSAVLSRDEALESSDIEVKSVNDGIVVLSGDAKTLSAHRRALEDARSVDGVRRVASEIASPDELGDAEIWRDDEMTTTADRGASRAMSDAWITTKAKIFLMAEPGLSPLGINVDTHRGVVTLFGIVGTDHVKRRAGAEVGKIEGVTALQNELQVVPEVAAERVETKDGELLASVEKRLGERATLENASIDIEVKNGVVRLTGTVASQRDRVTALTVTQATRGVDSVIDDLKLQRPRSSR